MTPLRTITSIKPIPGGHLFLTFNTTPDKVDEIDLSAMLAQGGVFESLRDPSHFAAVEIGPRGRTLMWRVGADEVDLCADALWLMAHPDGLNMNEREKIKNDNARRRRDRTAP